MVSGPVINFPPSDLLAPETTPAKALLQAQPPGAQPNIPATLEALFLPNESQSTTITGVPVSSRLPLGDLLAPPEIDYRTCVPLLTLQSTTPTSVMSRVQLQATPGIAPS